MAVVLGNRWEARWQMHEDQAGILKGVKDLAFTLRRISPDGSRPEYAFDHVFDEDSGLEDDPFKDTKFISYGNILPSPPARKLKSWKKSQETNYQNLISRTFGNASSNTQHLRGEKIFDGAAESLILVLLPQAVDFFDNGTRIVDLIYMTCRTRLEIKTKPLRGKRRAHIRQDGTAHGNPR